MESRWFNPMSRPTMASLNNDDDRSDKDISWSLRPQDRRKLEARNRGRNCQLACFAGIILLQVFIAAGVAFLVWSSVDVSTKLSPRTGSPCKYEPCMNGGVCFEGSNGYICNCGESWTGKNCETDVDECKTAPCGAQGTCTNTEGSFKCTCNDGYDPDAGCKDIDECLTDGICGDHAICNNTMGSYMCACVPGWVNDGPISCVDADECLGQPCSPGAQCENTEGGFECKCGNDVILPGESCTAVPIRPPHELANETGWTVGDSIVNGNWSAGAAGDIINGDCNQTDSFPFNVGNICGESNVGQAITDRSNHSGRYSWHYKRGVGNNYGSGTPFSPGLFVKVGRSDGNYIGDADSFYASFWFKAAKDYTNQFGDGSRILVAAGDTDGREPSSNYLEIYFKDEYRGKISVRTRESHPSYDECSALNNCGDDFDDIYTIVAENLDPLQWHHVEMTLRTKPEDYKDEWYYEVDGDPSSNSHGAYFKTRQYDEGRYLYVNRLNIAAMHPRVVTTEGFFFDDIYYKAFDSTAPSTILDEYSTSFEQ